MQQRPTVSLVVSPSKKRNPQSKSTSGVQQIENTALFLVMPPFGGLPGGNQAVPLQALLTDLLSPERQFTFKHKRSATEKTEKSFFSTFFCFFFPSKEGPVCRRYSEQDEDQTFIRAKTGRHTFIDRANAFTLAVPAMHTFSSRCA